MSSVDPFSSRFEVFGREARNVVPAINEQAFDRLRGALSPDLGADGRVVLLKAPRAGFGKTLLIQRAAEELTKDHHFVKVGLVGGRTIDSAHVLEFLLESLCQVLPAGEGLTMLDFVARRIIARGLEPLVRSGEVPCQDREGALLALQQSPVETFDFHHEAAVTAHWTEANFEVLGPRLASELAQVTGASLRESAYWVELFFRFAVTSPENVERSRLLFETIFQPEGLRPSESGAGERLHGLLSLMSIATTVVLVIDDTEGLSTHPPDALELGSFLTNLAQTCPGALVLLSVNTDVWETAFAPRLPGGLVDRLTEHEVTLQPLSREQAEDIVRSRGGNRAGDVLDSMTWAGEDLYARKVLKEASIAWESLEEERNKSVAGPEEKALEEALDFLNRPLSLDIPEIDKVEPDKSPAVETEEAVKPSSQGIRPLSPVAAALLAAGLEEESDTKAEEGAEEKVEAPLEAETEFEAASYAFPSTALTADPVEQKPDPEVEEAEPSSLSELASPSEPLVAETKEDSVDEDESSEPERSPFEAMGEPSGGADTPADEDEAAPVAEEKDEESPTSEDSGNAAAEEEAVIIEEKEETPSPFAPVAPKQTEDKSEEPAPRSPFAAISPEPTKTEPLTPAPLDPPPLQKEETPTSSPFAEAPAADPPPLEKEETPISSPFSPAPASDAPKEVVLPDEEPAKASPFAPVAESTPQEVVLPPESDSTPFRPLSASSESSSPFAPVTSSAESPTSPSANGLDALIGGNAPSAPVDPFAEGATDGVLSEESVSPFKPVGESGLPPKPPETSPFSRSIGTAPLEEVSPPPSSESTPPSRPEPQAPPEKEEDSSPASVVPSPFSPAKPPSQPEKPSPFAPVERGGNASDSAQEDEDKVDELLRQFKERYGRD